MSRIASLTASLAFVPAAIGQTLPVTQYFSASDSPFASLNLSAFYLEDFEDGQLNTPGLSITPNRAGDVLGPYGPSSVSDSVDGDDGAIDGLGLAGRSFASILNQSTESLGYTISFSSSTLGWLPTHVGLVWTDGAMNTERIVQFFDAQEALLGSITATTGDNSFFGGTGEDRFFGAVFLQGVARMTIRGPLSPNNLEIDHVQYGVNLPPCGPADIAGPNQSTTPDGRLTADDVIVYLSRFFANDPRANIAGPDQSTTPDAFLTADDVIVFLFRYFAGC